ncbi:MAG: LPS export ABC transporter permease LptG [Ancalomicrobiaceae bacterium]|nr:LPS export ABC transporter permease LptG [Ancalomicrobiaceae bacterium]
MMIGQTLGLYICRRFTRTILSVFGLFFAIVYLGDFLELFRRTAERPDFTPAKAALASLMRVPQICELVMPFAVLFGAIWAFMTLSRTLELVVARAAGISVWQFSAPALTVALTAGVIATTIYNPLGIYLKDQADQLTVDMFAHETRFSSGSSPSATWIRQDGVDGESIMHANETLNQGTRLLQVTAMTFDRNGQFLQRIDAAEADYANGSWTLSNGTIHEAKRSPQTFATLSIATYLTADQIKNALASPDSVPFWQLPGFIETSQAAGLPAFSYQLQYQLLLARPLLFAAMVLIAAAVSLRVFRFGNIGPRILSGAVAGFVLYVVGEIARGLGSVGIVPPTLAAWAPAVVASLMGFTILLYQEDG